MVDEKLIQELRKKDFQNLLFNNLLINSSVVKTLTKNCCLKCGSLDQIEELIDNASARYGESFGSSNACDAVASNFSYSKDLKNLILLSTSCCLISNSYSESFDFNKQTPLCLLSSDLIYSGAKNSACSDENKYELIDSGFIKEKKILLSNTNLIINVSYFLTFLSNSALIEGETSESNLLNESFFAFLPNSTLHFMNSCSSLDLSLLSNRSRFSFFRISSLASSDQFIQDNSLISDFVLSGIANVKDAIYISPFSTISSNFFNCLTLRIIIFLNTSDHLTSGNSSSLFFKSSGIDSVTVAIFVCTINYVNESKYVCIFKPLDFESISTTIPIHFSSFSFNFLCIDFLTLTDNKSASFSVNLDLETVFRNLPNPSWVLNSDPVILVCYDEIRHIKILIENLDLRTSGELCEILKHGR